MSKWAKFWEKREGGRADNDIDFSELVNFQPRRDGKTKGYQVKQVRAALDEYTGDDKDGWLRGKTVL